MDNIIENPYAPLTDNETEKGQHIQTTKHDQKTAQSISPIPDHIQMKYPKHTLGQPKFIWAYKNRQGKKLFFVCRFIIQNPDGTISKQDLPLTYRKNQQGHEQWQWKGIDKPRPLYGLEKLDQSPQTGIIIVEGEKTAEACQKIFPDYIAMTSPNGAGSALNADWTPIKDRKVIIWRDHDTQGLGYQNNVIDILCKIGMQSIAAVKIPNDFPEKWDLADAMPQGYTDKDIQEMLNNAEACRSENSPEIGENVSPDDFDLAEMVINYIGADDIIHYAGNTYIYNHNGLWKKQDDRALKKIIQDFLKPYRHKTGYRIKRGKIDSIIDALKTEIYTDINPFNDTKYFINLENGELHFDDQAQEWVLQPHNQKHYCISQIPIHYEPEVTAPRFEQYLNEIFAGDFDQQDKMTLMLELIIYSMMQHTKFEVFIMCYGMGSNGKSVFLNLLEVLIGTENIASVSLTAMQNMFKCSELFGKYANIVAEIDSNEKISDANIKKITTGDHIVADVKYKDSLSYRPFATCWFNINSLPYTNDTSYAFFRRAIIISFNKIIAEADKDRNLLHKLKVEKSGILNLALKAYTNALINDRLTMPQSCKDMIEEWKQEADHTTEFFDEYCVISHDQNDQELTAELYQAYKKWRVKQHEKPLAKHVFERILTQKHLKPHKGTQGKRYRKGIKLNQNPIN